MPRSIWKGSISFGLVNIPVKSYTAVRQKDVRFHQIHAPDGGRIRYKRVCEAEGKEVPSEEIVKGYETSPDTYVTVTPEELDALEASASRAIDVTDFVDLADIDPLYYQHAYYLLPEKTAEKAYALFHKALRETGKVAVGNVVMRGKETLVAIRAKEDLLVMSTMNFPDEVVGTEELGEEVGALPEVGGKELQMAEQLVDALAGPFEPTKFKDEYRERVLDLIEKKAQGEEIVVEPAPAPKKAKDLMAALEASLKAAREKRTAEGDGEAAA